MLFKHAQVYDKKHNRMNAKNKRQVNIHEVSDFVSKDDSVYYDIDMPIEYIICKSELSSRMAQATTQ